jgi:hypothetical protein
LSDLTSFCESFYDRPSIETDKVVPVLKHHALKVYGAVEVKLCAFLTWVLGGMVVVY